MKIPAVMYRGHVYTDPTGHLGALQRCIGEHCPNNTLRLCDEWLAKRIGDGSIKQGWLVNKRFVADSLRAGLTANMAGRG